MTATQQTQKKTKSLDLPTTDFHLFWSLEHFISRRTIRNKEIQNSLSNLVGDKTQIFLNKVFGSAN